MKNKIKYNIDAIQMTIVVLIPRRRGEGFLKSPFGGHYSNRSYWDFLNQMHNEKDFKDATDIDGYLSIILYIANFDDNFIKLKTKIISILNEIFKHTEGSEEISSNEFWKIIDIN